MKSYGLEYYDIVDTGYVCGHTNKRIYSLICPKCGYNGDMTSNADKHESLSWDDLRFSCWGCQTWLGINNETSKIEVTKDQ